MDTHEVGWVRPAQKTVESSRKRELGLELIQITRSTDCVWGDFKTEG